MTAIEDFLELLEVNEFGTVGNDLFMNAFPDDPNNIITILLGAPYNSPRGLDDIYVHFIIHIRCANQADALLKSKNIYSFLVRNKRELSCPSSRILLIKNIQTPYFLDTDERGRSSYTIDLDLITDSF
jgi:hypothetical protein